MVELVDLYPTFANLAAKPQLAKRLQELRKILAEKQQEAAQRRRQ